MPSIFPLFTLVRRLVPSSLPSAHTDAIHYRKTHTRAPRRTITRTQTHVCSHYLSLCLLAGSVDTREMI